MGKSHRGKGIIQRYHHGRGTCPVCGRSGVKLLYPRKVNGADVEVCKRCRTQ